ncbi:MAG: bifunctional folylpolyglutamate synthase/dihydrofolate synthase [Thermodesulfobacteriota bacterium]
MADKTYYHQCLEAMYGLRRFGIKLGLETIQTLLAGLGNPQNDLKCIHVAGTNGKGSIASALSTILRLSGFKVGLYTSPHLVRFNERIRIDNQPISDEDVLKAYEAVKSIPTGEREPTFFEFTTAMGLYLFRRRGVEWALIETGMGGRLDATNILSPQLSIITNISLEHQEYLGDTIADIAFEKGGIIKPHTPVVTGVQQEEAAEVLRRIAREKSAPLFRLGEQFQVETGPDRTFTYRGMDQTWSNLRTGLAGDYQIDNAALVLAACEVLNRADIDISPESIRNGLLQNRWPGRLEIVSENPLVILDGAHNLAAAENLAGFLKKEMSDRSVTLVVGILDDKPYQEMLAHLLPNCRKVILTRPKIDRSLPTETLLKAVREIRRTDRIEIPPDSIQQYTIQLIPSVAEAVRIAISSAAPDEVICIAGSLYVVGEAKEYLGEESQSDQRLF